MPSSSSASIATSSTEGHNPTMELEIHRTYNTPLTVTRHHSQDNQNDRTKRTLIMKNSNSNNGDLVNNIESVEKAEYEVRNSIIAGSIAGITSISLFHPFDVIRTKMQATTKLLGTTVVAKAANTQANAGITSSSGPLAVIAHTYKNGGLRAFYTGISLPLAAQAVYKSTVLTTNRVTTNLLSKWKTQEKEETAISTPYILTLGDHFFCGAMSGTTNALLFVSPVEFVRNQLIQQHTQRSSASIGADVSNRGPIDVIRNTIKSDGILGLWRGAAVTVVRDSVGCGGFFIMNEIGKRYISIFTEHQQGSLMNTLGSGCLAGFGYWSFSLPFDTMKTLVQTGKSSSAFEAFSLLVKRDGGFGAMLQLYRGWQMAFGRGVPSAAVTLTTYSIVYTFCETVFS